MVWPSGIEMLNQVIFKTGDIIEEQTDGLVCSGNVQLNMSGGANGELLKRGGLNMQRELHDWLRAHSKKYVDPGFVMRIGPEPTHFTSIIYTVAIDGWYDSSVDLVATALSNALVLLAEDGCASVSIPALATGYGHLSKSNFGRALQRCLEAREWPFDDVRVVLRSDSSLQAVKAGFQGG